MTQKGSIPAIVIILIVLIGLVVTLKLSQTTQIFQPKAYDNQSQQTRFSSNGLNIEVLQWVKDSTRISIDSSGQSGVLVNNVIYYKGSDNPENSGVGNKIYSVQVDEKGKLAVPVEQKPLPKNSSSGSLVNYNAFLYYIGGLYSEILEGRKIYRTKIFGDGSLEQWEIATNLPEAIYRQSAFAYQGKLYVLGGMSAETGSTSNRVYSITINEDGSLGSSWTEIGRLPASLDFPSFAFDGTNIYVNSSLEGTLRMYSSKILADGKFRGWGIVTWPEGFPDFKTTVPIHTLNGRLLLFDLDSIYYAPILSEGTVGEWTRSTFNLSEIVLFNPWVFSGNYGYSLNLSSPTGSQIPIPRSIALSFDNIIPSSSPSPTPSNGTPPIPPNPDARVSNLRLYVPATNVTLPPTAINNVDDRVDLAISFTKSWGINAVNLWVDYCERWNNDGTCNFETGEIITQKEVSLEDSGSTYITLDWPNTHPKHTPGPHKVGVHAYYCTPGTKDCYGFPALYQDINVK